MTDSSPSPYITEGDVTTKQAWAQDLLAHIRQKSMQERLDVVPSALGWPKVNDFPRPGAAANYANAKTLEAAAAALKRITRMGGEVEYHRPTDTAMVGSRHLGWAVIP